MYIMWESASMYEVRSVNKSKLVKIFLIQDKEY